ncbi:VTT domain-containing protein [Methylobacter sp. Wu8]|uniref:TVP38/TMEM64 family protein n=1 Tax=Methylobacter sp. Wu8 TaxID=3118457 RepID=UPI002F2BB2DA|nr:VTT domain-containing protein [Methylobacter tundripaludum]
MSFLLSRYRIGGAVVTFDLLCTFCSGESLKQLVEHFLVWIQPILVNYPLAAPLVFIGVHTLMAVFFLPCSPMTLMAGVLWGGGYGLVVSICAAMASSATTFFLSRSFLHGKIEKVLVQRYPKVAGMLVQAVVHDWKLIAVSQLNPLIPASTMGYVFGLSRITFTRYLMFSGIFMLPLQALFVMTGHSVTSIFTADGHWEIALALILLVLTAPLVTKRIYRKLCQLFGVKNGA